MKDQKKFVWNRDRISSVGIFLVAIAIMIMTSKIKPTFGNIGGSDPGSKLFPYIISILMAICAVGKFITHGEPDNSVFVGGGRGWLRIGILLAELFAYIFILPYAGYWAGTIVFAVLLVYTMKLKNRVNPIVAVVFAVILTAVMYTLFGVLLKVKLPASSILRAIQKMF